MLKAIVIGALLLLWCGLALSDFCANAFDVDFDEDDE
jgi:hypothetical protein